MYPIALIMWKRSGVHNHQISLSASVTQSLKVGWFYQMEGQLPIPHWVRLFETIRVSLFKGALLLVTTLSDNTFTKKKNLDCVKNCRLKQDLKQWLQEYNFCTLSTELYSYVIGNILYDYFTIHSIFLKMETDGSNQSCKWLIITDCSANMMIIFSVSDLRVS